MGITLEQSEKSSVIRLEGIIDIAAAAEFKKVLLRASETGDAIEVSVEGATGLDVTAVQLIGAARRVPKVQVQPSRSQARHRGPSHRLWAARVSSSFWFLWTPGK